jgi:hypothetical protein
VQMAHTCNPSYSGGRDQKDCGSKPAQANSSVRAYLEETHHKKGLVEWLKVQALSSIPRMRVQGQPGLQSNSLSLER